MSSRELIPPQVEEASHVAGLEVPAFVQNAELVRWVEEWIAICKPDRV